MLVKVQHTISFFFLPSLLFWSFRFADDFMVRLHCKRVPPHRFPPFHAWIHVHVFLSTEVDKWNSSRTNLTETSRKNSALIYSKREVNRPPHQTLGIFATRERYFWNRTKLGTILGASTHQFCVCPHPEPLHFPILSYAADVVHLLKHRLCRAVIGEIEEVLVVNKKNPWTTQTEYWGHLLILINRQKEKKDINIVLSRLN